MRSRLLSDLRRLRQLTLQGDVSAAHALVREAQRRGDDALLRLSAWAIVKAGQRAVFEVRGALAPLIAWKGETCLSAPLDAPRRMRAPFPLALRWDEPRARAMACDCVEAVLDLLTRRQTGDPDLPGALAIARDDDADLASLRDARRLTRAIQDRAASPALTEAARALAAVLDGRRGEAARYAEATLSCARAAARAALETAQPQLAAQHVSLRWQALRLLDHLFLDGPPEQMAPLDG